MSEEDVGAFGPVDGRRALCPECEKETNVLSLFDKTDRWSDADGHIQGINSYYVFQCKGCDTVFFAKASSNAEDYYDYYDFDTGEETRDYPWTKVFWPSAPKTPTPSWAGFNLALKDETLHNLLKSIYTAANSDMPILAAIGMRTAFDRVSHFLEIDTALPFADKLEAMRKGGHISGVQKGTLEVLINAGNAAAHSGWSPDAKQLSTLLEILEALIRDQFILKSEVRKLSKAVPKRAGIKPAE